MAVDINKKLAELSKKKGKQENKFAGEGKVIVKAGAYQSMLMHVLRFASIAMDPAACIEVMGMLVGKVEGPNVVIYEAVPVSHGGRIEVQFAPEDYAAFAAVDEQNASKGLWSIGWYHSHPNLKTFLSKVDVRNQLGFQTEANPKAIAIVFDHMYLENEGDLGFRAYRLDDIRKGISSEWHEVEATVETPEKQEFFLAVKHIVEAAHKKTDTYVKELSESEWAVEAPEIGVEEGGEAKAEVPTISPLAPALDGFQSGVRAFSDSFLRNFTDQIDEWTGDIKKAATRGIEPLVEAMESMQDGVVDGLGRVQGQFEKAVGDRIKTLEESVGEVLKKFEGGAGNLAEPLNNLAADLSQALGDHLQAKFQEKLGELEQILSGAMAKMGEFSRLTGSLGQVLNTQGENVKALGASASDLVASISTKNQGIAETLQGALEFAGQDVADLRDDLKSKQESVGAALKEVEDLIKEIRGLF